MSDEIIQPIPDCIATRIAAGVYEEVDDECPWLLLLLSEENNWQQAEEGDLIMRGRLGWTP